MNYGSLCSGIEAATCAWHPLGWKPAFFSEIEPFPSAVIAHHHTAPNLGDMTKFRTWKDYAIDILVGGTPCQSFSVAGLRKGLADPRGNLMLTYLAIAARYRPEWLVWENVPGVLSSGEGRDFGALLGGLAELGYGFAYRVLDAQFVRVESHARAVPQRRRRVFVVGCLGGWRRAAAVLFERESLRGDSPPRRITGERPAPTLGAGPSSGGRNYGTCADSAEGLIARGVAHSLCSHQAKGGDPTTDNYIAFAHQQGGSIDLHMAENVGLSLQRNQGQAVAIRTEQTGSNGCGIDETGVSYTLDGANGQAVSSRHSVRRLTPRECERLQGFPDDYTAIPWRGRTAGACPDGPRYKALGNSMAVNCMRWIGERIQQVALIQ